jgi:hypothetical protein
LYRPLQPDASNLLQSFLIGPPQPAAFFVPPPHIRPRCTCPGWLSRLRGIPPKRFVLHTVFLHFPSVLQRLLDIAGRLFFGYYPLGSDDLIYILVAATLFYAQHLRRFSSKPAAPLLVYANLHALSPSEMQLVVFAGDDPGMAVTTGSYESYLCVYALFEYFINCLLTVCLSPARFGSLMPFQRNQIPHSPLYTPLPTILLPSGFMIIKAFRNISRQDFTWQVRERELCVGSGRFTSA